MPDVASVLKEEIARLARKEVKQQVEWHKAEPALSFTPIAPSRPGPSHLIGLRPRRRGQ